MSYLSCLSGSQSFEDAVSILRSKNLKVITYPAIGLYQVKYNKNTCDMNNPDVRKCRGLILSQSDNSIVCPVPQKSASNVSVLKNYTGNVNKYTISEFIDGTMINYFQHNGVRYISTRSCIGAQCRWLSEQTFSEMFDECLKSTELVLDSLDMDYCYSFLIQHPNNRIVKQYQTPSLVLTHVSRVVDGSVQFLDVHDFVNSEEHTVNVAVPTTYKFDNIEDVYHHVSSLEETEQGVMVFEKDIENPGYLMDLCRYKIRNLKYNQVRTLKGNTNNLHYLFFSLRKSGNGSYEQYIKYFDEHRVLFEEYRQELYTLTADLFKTYLDCFINRNPDGTPVKVHKTIEYEFKPLVAELHAAYMATRNPTTKNSVIQYLHNLPIPRLLFVIHKRRERVA